MKTYITTDKHPELKEGVEFEADINEQIEVLKTSKWVSAYTVKHMLKKGYIKEVEEPIWTDEDAYNIFHKTFNEFINQRGLSLEFSTKCNDSWPTIFNRVLQQFKKEKGK